LSREKLDLESLKLELLVIQNRVSSYWGEMSPGFNGFQGDLFKFSSDIPLDLLYEKVKSSPSVQLYVDEYRLKQAEIQLAKANSKSDLQWKIGVRQFEETSDTAFVVGLSVPLFSG